jgi:hypothetical protein
VIDYFFNSAAPINPEDGSSFIDEQAPLLQGIRFLWGTNPRIIWYTDEPASSYIEYGETSILEQGYIGNDDLVWFHSVVLENLQPGTSVFFRVISEDKDGNEAISEIIETEYMASDSIDIWYGSEQSFGQIGIPQRWINILGNAFDEDGIIRLESYLNDDPPTSLSLGPDYARLVNEGDFNVEISITDLQVGQNILNIIMEDFLGNQTVKSLIVNFDDINLWPETYYIDWSITNSINDVAQIVDGKWRIEAGRVRTVEPGYDRLIAIGARSWTNYEVTVPVIVHSIADNYFFTPIVGILTRWQGHVANGSQPSDQWWPLGALASYSFGASPSFEMWLSPNDVRVANSGFVFELGTEYIFKLRSETIGNYSLYKFKIWKSSEQEPLSWDQVEEELNDDQTTGSILLLAHEVDASFGNVTISPIGP